MSEIRGCLFCDIAAGRAEASRVYEDDHTVAFSDLYPASPGHTLVIPREHYRDLHTVPPELAGRLMQTTATVARGVQRALKPRGINLLQSNGAAAGQSVWHIHMHIIPRYGQRREGNDVTICWRARQPGRQELERIAGRIRAALED